MTRAAIDDLLDFAKTARQHPQYLRQKARNQQRFELGACQELRVQAARAWLERRMQACPGRVER